MTEKVLGLDVHGIRIDDHVNTAYVGKQVDNLLESGLTQLRLHINQRPGTHIKQ